MRHVSRHECLAWALGVVLSIGLAAPPLEAAIMVTGTNNPAALGAALVAGGGGSNCISITDVQVSSLSKLNGAVSIGTFTLSPPAPGTSDYDLVPANGYDDQPDGVIMSTGNALVYGSGPNTNMMMSTQYNVVATTEQANLLKPVAGDGFGFLDVTELTIKFDMGNAPKICFDLVFGTEEWLKMFTFHNDAFAAYLNGTNIAIANGQGTAANNPGAAEYPAPPQTTELNGVIFENGSPRLRIMAAVTPGSQDNILKFIIGDTGDSQVDSTVYITNLMCCPEPSTWAMGVMGSLALVGGAGFRRRARLAR